MGFKSTVLKCFRHTGDNMLLVLFIQLLLASFTLVSVRGCFPYHRGKVETSIVKLEHIDKVRLYSPYTATGNLDQGAGGYRQAQSPNVSVIVNFILPNNSDQKNESSEKGTKGSNSVHIDRRTQQKLAETVNNVLYGQRPKRK